MLLLNNNNNMKFMIAADIATAVLLLKYFALMKINPFKPNSINFLVENYNKYLH